MTRTLPLMPILGAAAALTGLAILARPAIAARLLRTGTGDAATYALRIIGAMLFALGLFLGGFALALNLTS